MRCQAGVLIEIDDAIRKTFAIGAGASHDHVVSTKRNISVASPGVSHEIFGAFSSTATCLPLAESHGFMRGHAGVLIEIDNAVRETFSIRQCANMRQLMAAQSIITVGVASILIEVRDTILVSIGKSRCRHRKNSEKY